MWRPHTPSLVRNRKQPPARDDFPQDVPQARLLAHREFRPRTDEGSRGSRTETPATGRGGFPATRSGALGIGGNRGGARPSRPGEASAHETA